MSKTTIKKHEPAETYVHKEGWPDMRKGGPRVGGMFDTFEQNTIKAVTIPPGEVLYRVVDPKSSDNSSCWMRKAEFDKLKDKADWRKRFAVWANWNSNGEFTRYTVPPGKGLHAWEGVVGTQTLHKELAPNYKLDGGAIQLVVDPVDLDIKHVSPRKPTGWGYGDETIAHDPDWNQLEKLGLSKLKTSWREYK